MNQFKFISCVLPIEILKYFIYVLVSFLFVKNILSNISEIKRKKQTLVISRRCLPLNGLINHVHYGRTKARSFEF